jgi:hypothetical protein
MSPRLKIDRRQILQRKAWRLASALFLGACAWLLLSSYRMVEPDINAKVKVLFLYQISKYVMWPTEPSPNGFTIGLYGEYPELFSELNKLAAEKKRGDQPYVIIQYKQLSEIKSCHVLYLTPERDGDISKVLEKLKGKNTLLVTDKDGMIKKGACINFFYEDNKQRFEVSNENVKQQGLKISTKLSSIAKVID